MKRSTLRLAGVLALLSTPAPAAVTIVDAVRSVSATVSQTVDSVSASGAGATGVFDESKVVAILLEGSGATATAEQTSFIAPDGLLYEASNETSVDNESSVIGTDAFAPVDAVSDFLVEFEITGVAHTAHLTAGVAADAQLGGSAESSVVLEIPLGATLLSVATNGGAAALDEMLLLDPGLYRLRASSISSDEGQELFFAGGNYEFRLELTPIPEPSALLLTAVPALALVLRRRRIS
jgi:hypothetical protein